MVSDIITPGETPPGSHGLTDVAGCISSGTSGPKSSHLTGEQIAFTVSSELRGGPRNSIEHCTICV